MEFGRVLHGFDDFDIAGATANVAAESRADFVFARVWVASQQSGRGHDEPGRAIPALRAELLMKATLHRGKAAVLAERFNRVYASPGHRRREREARKPRPIIDEHRAGAAFTPVATGFGPGQPDHFPQII